MEQIERVPLNAAVEFKRGGVLARHPTLKTGYAIFAVEGGVCIGLPALHPRGKGDAKRVLIIWESGEFRRYKYLPSAIGAFKDQALRLPREFLDNVTALFD